MTDPVRVRELLLENLFSVFNVRDPRHLRAFHMGLPEKPPA